MYPRIIWRFMFRTVLVATVVISTVPAGFGVAHGQSATPGSRTAKSDERKALEFEVVSIKPTPSSFDRTLIQQFPDGTAFHGAPVRMILETALAVEEDHILGAPSWVNTNRYDVEAKVPPEDAPGLDKLTGAERNAMLIPLLTERFHLKYHREMRERPTYALVVAKGGPRMTKGEPDPPGGFKPDNGEPKDPAKEHYKIMTVPGHIEADSVPMGVLADVLTRLHALGRTVVDRTGLTENYSFTLRWTPDSGLPPLDPYPAGSVESGLANAGAEAAPSSLFSAIEEQLGLKLEPKRESVEVIVIDHIEPPSPN